MSIEEKEVTCVPAGDCAMLAVFQKKIQDTVNDRVHALAKALENEKMEGVRECVPGFCTLLIYYQPEVISFHRLREKVEVLNKMPESTGKKKKRILEIPCCYGARFGPDLGDMETYLELSREEIIEIHSSVDYKIYMLGFLPGFVYLGGLDKRIEIPRLQVPRLQVPQGAVGIGGNQTGVYPLASPGGWRLMGATPVAFYDPGRKDPVLCRAGEYIRFVPITIGDYYDIRQMIQRNTYEIECVEEETICP